MTMVLLVLRRVKSGKKSSVIRMGARSRVFVVSAHIDGAIVATGPAA